MFSRILIQTYDFMEVSFLTMKFARTFDNLHFNKLSILEMLIGQVGALEHLGISAGSMFFATLNVFSVSILHPSAL
jgi:hypothetical protein